MNRSRVTDTAECPPEAVINHGPGVRRFKEQPGRLAASLMNSRCQPYHVPPSLEIVLSSSLLIAIVPLNNVIA